ncbi:11805_t:CDS:2, partial [Acaulospora colombiana]
MPSVTLGRKRPSEAIVESGTKPKKLKFTDDGEAVVVSSTTSKVKPDYSKLTKKDKKEHKPYQDGVVNDVTSSRKEHSVAKSSLALSEEIDFPRGGGSSLTPLELKETRAEGIREADSQIFKDSNIQTSAPRKRLRSGKLKDGVQSKSRNAPDAPRIEYLTYKKLQPETRIMAQVVGITPLSVIVSLPHQLMGHIPIDKISSDLNNAMDRLMDKDSNASGDSQSSNDEGEEDTEHAIPTLEEIFYPGQYVRAIVTAVHPQGTSLPPLDNSETTVNLGKPRNELERASRRVELSLLPEQVNKGISGKDLIKDFVSRISSTLPVSISSVEDHGYILNLGIHDTTGFLSFDDAGNDTDRLSRSSRLKVGTTLVVSVKQMEENGRMCSFIAGDKINKCELSSLISINAVHPGSLVQALVTAASSRGVNVQILGVFNGTIHPLHASKDPSTYSIGKKIKARILWDIPGTEPKQFALSTLDHIRHLKSKFDSEPSPDDGADHEATQSSSLDQQFPIGAILGTVKVTDVEADRGLTLTVTDGINGIVHISDVSDEHVPSLSATSGLYKIGSVHRARVTGYHYLDGTLQCSMKESILEQKWLRVDDVKVGEIVKGTVVNLTDRGLFVSISGSVHAVIWPNHYADIRLKHPERKFKSGKT